MTAPRGEVVEGYHLSTQQKQAWRLLAAGSVPVTQMVLTSATPLDLVDVRSALVAVVSRHEALRTRFRRLPGLAVPLQVIGEPAIDLQDAGTNPDPVDGVIASADGSARSGAPPAIGDERGDADRDRIAQLGASDRERPFDLEAGPLVRGTLVRVAEHHVLIVTTPALCADARSFEVVAAELAHALGGRTPAPAPDDVIQYAQYADWQGGVLERVDSSGGTPSPGRGRHAGTGRSQPVVVTHEIQPSAEALRPHDLAVTLSRDVARAFAEAARTRGVTERGLLLACWLTLLARSAGRREIRLGLLDDNRPFEGMDCAVGPFARFVPAAFTLRADARLETLASTLEASHLARVDLDTDAIERDERAFAGWADRRPSTTFAHTFAYRNLPRPDHATAAVTLAHVTHDADRFVAQLSALRGDELSLWLRYDPAALPTHEAQRLADRLSALVTQVAHKPEGTVGTLDIVTAGERRILLHEGTGAAVDLGPDTPVHRLIEAHARATPDRVAVALDDGALRYGELDARASALARRLRRLDIGAESVVAIVADRTPRTIAAILAILKAGAAYLPIHPETPPDRLRVILEDSCAALLLASPDANAAAASALPVDRLVLADALFADGERPEPIDVEVSPDALAYVIYTSGSTGRPKGVLVTHRTLVQSTRARAVCYGDEPPTFLLVSPLSFDSAVAGLFWSLCSGGTLWLASDGFQHDLDALIERAAVGGITHMLCLPSLYGAILDRVRDARRLASLRIAIVAGESCPSRLVERHRAVAPAVRLFNEYGPTEATVWCSVHECLAADAGRRVPIGRPIPNARLYVVDASLRLAPAGVGGELLVAGAGVTRGYLGRPDLTAERFLPDPFSETPGARVYRTGDRARWLEDGTLEFLGRTDDQVKIRGHRVEPDEVAARLAEHSSITECAVVARADEAGSLRLVAYVVSTTSSEDAAGWRAHLSTCVPPYMIPASFVRVDRLPRTPNGKIDRTALAGRPAVGPSRTLVPPETPTEIALASIWSEVLGVTPVGATDNFYELGGDSIRSIQVLARAGERGLDFPLQLLTRHPTVRELARQLVDGNRSLDAGGEVTSFALIPAADRARLPPDVEDAYPLAALQSGMLLISELQREAAVFHDVASVHLRAPFDSDALRDALDELASRHPVLRSAFDYSSFSEPLQLVRRRAAIPVDVVDLRGTAERAQQRVLDDWIAHERTRGFDWTTAPLLRFAVHRRSDDRFELAYSCHHAILDGWSAATMLVDLFQIYLHRLGRHPAPPRAPVSAYRDFVALERAAVRSVASRAFWTDALAGATVAELPRRIPATADRERGLHHVEIDAVTAAGVRRVAATAGVSLRDVLLAVHLRALSRITGADDVTTGLVSHGRLERRDGDRALGVFLNTVPVRMRAGAGTWLDLVQGVRRVSTELIPHRRFPLAEIQRARGGTPLFEAAFNFVHFHVLRPVGHVPGIEVLGERTATATDLPLLVTFSADPSSERLRLGLAHDGARIDAALARLIGEVHVNALRAIAADVRAPLNGVSLLPGPDLDRLARWGDGGPPARGDEYLHQRFEVQVRQTPDAGAIRWRSTGHSYSGIDARANRLSHLLAAAGARRGTCVGICLRRSPDLIVGMLAVLKAGAAYVPVDPAYPPARVAAMFEDARVDAVVTTSDLTERFAEATARPICLDRILHDLSRQPGDRPAARPSGRDLAYVLFTSGSTGRPKGVAIEHAQAAALLGWALETYGAAEAESTLFATSASFDLSIFEIFLPLSRGGRLVIVEDALGLATLDENEEVTLVNTVPSAMTELVRTGRLPRTVRTVNLAGEPLSRDLVERVYAVANVDRIVNLYGPTEATTYSTVAEQRRGDTDAPSIGRPIAGTRVYVLDAWLMPVPAGAVGEIHLGGAGVARGYVNRPELTAERFVPDPFSTEPGARMYRTGDLGRYAADGTVRFLGRRDQQVKLRGFRIELAEIESVLQEHRHVRQAAAIVADRPAGPAIVAFLAADTDLPLEEVQALAAARLPHFMRPAAFVRVDRLPLSPNGKTDRAALARRDAATGSASDPATCVPPATATEAAIVDLYAELLGRRRVSAVDSFFELGGHSLVAAQLVARLRATFDIDLPIRAPFDAPSPRRLAAEIDRALAAGTGGALPAIEPRAAPGPWPLAFGQESLWFAAHLDPGSPAYAVPVGVRLRGAIDAGALEAALTSLVARHAALRSTFDAPDGRPRLHVRDPFPLALERLDLSEIAETTGATTGSDAEADTASASATRAAALATAFAARPFDLEQGPLVRAALIRLGEADHVALLCLHHIISDGWTTGLLVSELVRLYAERAGGPAARLAALPFQYHDFARWQRRVLQGRRLQRLLAEWSTHLDHAPRGLDLPFDRVRRPAGQRRGGRHRVRLGIDLSRQLRDLARAERATLFHVLLAAWSALLARWTGARELCVGTPSAGRTQPALERIAGFFINTLVLRLDLAGDPTFRVLLARARHEGLWALAHQELPFERLAEHLGVRHELGRPVFYNVWIAFHNTPAIDIALPGVSAEPFAVDTGTAKFDLALLASDTEDLTLVIEYDADLFTGVTIDRLGRDLHTLFAVAAADPGATLSALDRRLAEHTRARQAERIAAIAATDRERLRSRRGRNAPVPPRSIPRG